MCARKFKKPVIGVTGSVGKTTTRQMIATVLSGCLNVYQTEGNLNSQIGVPLTLRRIDENAEAAVLKGISEPGQMEILFDMDEPGYLCRDDDRCCAYRIYEDA